MTTHTTQRSQALFEQACQIFPGGVNSPVRAFKAVGRTPFVVQRGQGPYLFDVDGNRYTDYVGSWGPLVLGHAHPKVVEAITAQARDGSSFGACAEQELGLARLIQRHVPSMEMLRFVSSGTEAGMSVLRLARGHTGRDKIIKFAGCYHGHSDALLVEAGSGVATLGLPGSAGVPAAFVQDTLSTEFNDLSGVELLFERFPQEIAAVIVEPVMGNAGLILPDPGFLQGLRTLTQVHGSLLIFDEVMTGFRVHLGGAQTLYGITPDLTMLGKVIGGGLPVGAFGGRAEIMERLAPRGPVYQAGTLSGNPLAMAAGAAALEEWGRPGVFDKTAAAAGRLVEAVRELGRRRGTPVAAHALGTMFCIFFRDALPRNYREARSSDLERFSRYFAGALERGLFFPPSQFEACFMSSAHDETVIEATIAALDAIFAAW